MFHFELKMNKIRYQLEHGNGIYYEIRINIEIYYFVLHKVIAANPK